MLQSKGRYSLDCINDVTCGSVWGTITTLENRTTTAQMIADVLGVDKLLDVYNVFIEEAAKEGKF